MKEYNMNFFGRISDEDAEKASNAYLMSTIALIIALPLPILNMIATIAFYIANRKKTYFVRFHCIQSLLPQILIIIINSIAVWWTFSILLDYSLVSNVFVGFIITVLLFNLFEFIVSLYAAVQTRKKQDVRYWIFGAFTELICKPDSAKGKDLSDNTLNQSI